MDLSVDRIKTAYDRAVRARGGKVDHDCPKFRAQFSHELKRVIIEDMLRSSDDCEPAGVAPDGVILWSPVQVAQTA